MMLNYKALLFIVVFLYVNNFIVQGLYVKGPNLYDDSGQKVLIRGISRPSLEWNPEGQFLSYQDYQKMKEWGCNTIRLSLNQDFWLKGSKKWYPWYKKVVRNQVNLIRSLDMAVILDLHWSDEGNLMNDNPGQKKMADKNSILFWKQVASLYKNDSNIIFELYNEPQIIPFKVWMNGGTFQKIEYVGMQQLYDAVRSVGAKNVVIVNGIRWGFDLSGVRAVPIKGYNIIFGSHPYNFDDKIPLFWKTSFGWLARKHPIIATEFGEFTCDIGFTKKFLEYAEQLGMHWTAWSWWAQDCAFPSLIEKNGEPTESGKLVREYLLKNLDKENKKK